jgi:EAL domain-containing protein (putative c-di-GMP-specific phosphodiesterase class I)
VTSALQASGLPPHRLELEITESVLLANDSATNAALAAFQRLGIELAMDDFGTGYSSLSYLLGFRFGQIKIDRAFVAAIHRDGAAEAIIRAVIGMSRSLGIATTAEGVETAEQLAFLQRAGCSEIQGFIYDKPLTEADMMRRLGERAPARRAA